MPPPDEISLGPRHGVGRPATFLGAIYCRFPRSAHDRRPQLVPNSPAAPDCVNGGRLVPFNPQRRPLPGILAGCCRARLAPRRWRSSRPGSTRARGNRGGSGRGSPPGHGGHAGPGSGHAADIVNAVRHGPASRGRPARPARRPAGLAVGGGPGPRESAGRRTRWRSQAGGGNRAARTWSSGPLDDGAARRSLARRMARYRFLGVQYFGRHDGCVRCAAWRPGTIGPWTTSCTPSLKPQWC